MVKSGIESVWHEWKTIRLLGEGSFGKVYEAERNQYGLLERSAVKVIAIPTSMAEVQSLYHDGMTETEIETYYKGLVEEFVGEISLMSKLRGHINIVGYEDYAVVERKDSFGWDIYIRMELLTSLPAFIHSRNHADDDATIAGKKQTVAAPFDEHDVVQMAVDICTALEACYERHIVHRDIKPDNVFVSADGVYKLGDFGVAKTVEKTVSGLSKKGTYMYMAPEIYKGELGGMNSDLYSLGIMMYKLLNDNREPFLPDVVGFADKQQAFLRRVNGEAVPPPKYGTDALRAIVRKACMANARERYQTPTEMKQALLSLNKDSAAKTIVAASPVNPPAPILTPTIVSSVPSEKIKFDAPTTVEAMVDRGYMALEDRHFPEANVFFERALDQNAKCAPAYFGKFLAAMSASNFEWLAKYRLNRLAAVREKRFYIRPDNDHIETFAKNHAVPGYLNEATIKKAYNLGDFSYLSTVESCEDRYRQEKTFWEDNQFINRALKFAVGDEAAEYTAAKTMLFGLLDKNLSIVKITEKKEHDAALARYVAKLKEVDDLVERSYKAALKKREEAYVTAKTAAEEATNLEEYEDALELCEAVYTYRDIGKIADMCREQIAYHKKIREKKEKRRGVIILITVSVISVVAAALVYLVPNVFIPQSKYNQAEELLAAGQYQEALTAFDELGEYKDSRDRVKQVQYQWANHLAQQGNTYDAIRRFYELGPYSDSRKRCMSLWDTMRVNETLSLYSAHTVGLKADGTVVAVGLGDNGRCDVGDWTDIVSVAAGGCHTIGLKEDGTVVAVGNHADGQCDVSGWTDIVSVSAGGYHTVGLKADGTVVAVGDDSYGRCNVGGWTDIVAVSAGGYHTVGLKADGTVVAVGLGDNGRCDVSDWTDIVAISAGYRHTVGLKADGTVVAVGDDDHRRCDVSDWTGIVSVSAGGYHTVGLKADGTVVAVGLGDNGRCDVSDWTGIVAVDAGHQQTVGLKADGTVVTVGDNDYPLNDANEWTDIKLPV